MKEILVKQPNSEVWQTVYCKESDSFEVVSCKPTSDDKKIQDEIFESVKSRRSNNYHPAWHLLKMVRLLIIFLLLSISAVAVKPTGGYHWNLRYMNGYFVGYVTIHNTSDIYKVAVKPSELKWLTNPGNWVYSDGIYYKGERKIDFIKGFDLRTPFP